MTYPGPCHDVSQEEVDKEIKQKLNRLDVIVSYLTENDVEWKTIEKIEKAIAED